MELGMSDGGEEGEHNGAGFVNIYLTYAKVGKHISLLQYPLIEYHLYDNIQDNDKVRQLFGQHDNIWQTKLKTRPIIVMSRAPSNAHRMCMPT